VYGVKLNLTFHLCNQLQQQVLLIIIIIITLIINS